MNASTAGGAGAAHVGFAAMARVVRNDFWFTRNTNLGVRVVARRNDRFPERPLRIARFANLPLAGEGPGVRGPARQRLGIAPCGADPSSVAFGDTVSRKGEGRLRAGTDLPALEGQDSARKQRLSENQNSC